MRRYVKSPTHRRSGAIAVKSRPTRSWALVRGRIADRGPPRPPASLRATQARGAHQPGDLIAPDPLAVADERGVHPPHPVALVVLSEDLADLHHQPLVLQAAR